MEKYRYRHKADEIKDAGKRKHESKHHSVNEWGGTRGAPNIMASDSRKNEYTKSLHNAHKSRLIETMKHDLRGTTPER